MAQRRSLLGGQLGQCSVDNGSAFGFGALCRLFCLIVFALLFIVLHFCESVVLFKLFLCDFAKVYTNREKWQVNTSGLLALKSRILLRFLSQLKAVVFLFF